MSDTACFIGNSGVTLTHTGEKGTSPRPDETNASGGVLFALQLVPIRDVHVEYKGDISYHQISLSVPQKSTLPPQNLQVKVEIN